MFSNFPKYRTKAARRVFIVLVAWLFACLQPLQGRERETELTPDAAAKRARAAELMERVFCYADSNAFGEVQYTSDVYLRQNMLTHRNGPIVRYLPGMFRLEKGTHKYLTEARLRFQFRPPGEVDCKVVAYNSTARYQRADRFSEMGNFNFRIYETKLFTDRLLSPLHERNRKFYRYDYLYTKRGTKDSPPTARVSIRPRFGNEQLTTGHIDVNLQTGAVTDFQFSFRYNMQRITVSGRLGREGYETLVPSRMRIVSDFKLLGNRVYEVMEIFSHHTFSCPLPSQEDGGDRFDLTRLCMLRIDTARIITAPAYFDSIRPMELRPAEIEQVRKYLEKEAETYDKSELSDPQPAVSSPDSAQDISKKPIKYRIFGERTQDVLLSSHAFNLTGNGRANLKLPPVITPSMIEWSGTKGLSLKTQIRLSLNTTRSSARPNMEFKPGIGYSFKQKQIYWQLPYQLLFCPQLSGVFTLEAGGGSRSYNSRQADELRERLEGVDRYDSLLHIIEHYGFHDYRDTYTAADLSLSPHPGVRLTLGGRYHRRTLIEWNELAQATGLQHKLTTLGPRMEVEWTPAQYYYREGRRRVPLYSHYPTLRLSYERGYGIGGGATRYERLEADARYRLPLYAMRTLYFRAGGGLYTLRGKDCFLDYDFFKFDYMPAGWTDEMTGEFQLLNARWYNESRYYLRFTSTYESPMLLFSRIPRFSRIVLKERIYLNLLSVHSLGFYSEAGYAISTHLLDMGFFTGVAADGTLKFGGKLVLHFFDR